MLNLLKKITLIYYLISPKIFGFGYNQYKYYLIKKLINKKETKFLNSYMDERIIEIPWVVNKLKKFNNKKILDVGSTLNFKYLLDIFLKKNKIFFCNIYKEKNDFSSNQVSYIQNNILEGVFKNNFFDCITVISVLEHIGFDNSIYNIEHKNPKMKTSKNKLQYLKALKEIKRILKKGGKSFFSVPFGKKQYFKNYMQFDINEVNKLKKVFKLSKIKILFFKYDGIKKKWIKSSANECKNVQAISKNKIGISSNAVALIEITK